MVRPSIPQGTRDFGADVVRKRNYIFNTIREVFELYGFQPLETPAMENLETLMGKYGQEGDKLIFKILNNGLDNPSKYEQAKQDFDKLLEGINTKGITDRALRYDLTIPFARYVAMNHGQLTFPYKRYQIQPVWRADRPQKGRYREFYQCDADLVGSNSLWNDAEFALMYADVFERLKIEVDIKINNRKILTALAEICHSADKIIDITVAIDKLDKIGIEKVTEELSQKGLDKNQLSIIEQYVSIDGSNVERLRELKKLIATNQTGKQGVEEIEFVLHSSPPKHSHKLIADFTLARGLNYYTGIIFEAKAKNVSMGSIGGGGRYDDLTGLFGLPNIPGVGISFGVDRIYDVMEELKLFPEQIHVGTKVLFFNLGDEECKTAFQLMHQLRNKNLACELYHEQAKFEKQFKYAEKKNIPFAVIIGSKELAEGTCTIKNLKKGNQESVSTEKLLDFLLNQENN